MSANVGESYNEQILQATIDGDPYVNENPYPSRIEVLLMELKEAIEQGSGAVIDTTVNGTSENAVQNKAIYNYVNSSVSTNTANFIGTFNSVDALESYGGTVTNNDYAFVVGNDSDGNTVYNRYKYNGENETWSFEYALNNSSFTAAQWAAINSGLTSSDKTKIDGLGAASTKGFDPMPTSGNTNNAVSSDGVYQAMIPITAELVELVDRGAKNLAKLRQAPSSPNTQISGSISNGVVMLSTSATISANSEVMITDGNFSLEAGKKYIISGCPGDGSVRLFLRNSRGNFVTGQFGDAVEYVPQASGNYDLIVFLYSGVSISNFEIKPMICTAEDYASSSEFVPYAPTNRELYEMILALQT